MPVRNEEVVILGDTGAGELDLTLAPYMIEAFDPGVAKRRPNWVSGPNVDGAVLDEEPHYDNAETMLRIRVWQDDPTQMDAALAAVGELVDKLQETVKRDGGLPFRWTPAQSSDTYTMYALLAEIDGVPITAVGDDAGWLQARPVLAIKLTRRPFLYGSEQTAGGITIVGAPLVVIEVPGVPGDVAAEGRLVITEPSGIARRHVEWGVEQRNYNPSTSLTVDSDAMVTAGYSGTSAAITGAYSTNAISAPVTARQTAVCALPDLAHVGTYRVKARVFATAKAVRARLAWRAGDGPLMANAYVGVPVSGAWCEVDVGLVTLPAAALGAQRWGGQIETLAISMEDDTGATVATHTLRVDVLWLIPAGEAYGKIRAGYTYKPGALLGTDEFAGTTAGNALNGRTAPVGGTWATSGAATGDFLFDDDAFGSEGLKRNTASDTGPRFALLGAATPAAVDAGARVKTMSAASGTYYGVVARYVDASNYLRAVVASSALSGNDYLRVQKVKAGTATTIATSGRFPAHFSYWIRLIVFASGTFVCDLLDENGAALYTISGSDADLATGGTLASGKAGLIDYYPSASAQPRYFDEFYLSTPPTEPVVIYPSRRLEVRHDGNLREDSAGVSWGALAGRGGRFLLSPAGDRGLTSRVAVKVRDNDVDAADDPVINRNITIEARYTPRYLLPR